MANREQSRPLSYRVRSIHTSYARTQDRNFRILLGVQVAYFVLLFGFLIYTRTWPTPDQIAFGMLILAFAMARPLRFLRDWFPFIFLILSYEALRGISDGLLSNAHISFPIEMDEKVFGVVPTVYLQERLWDPNNLQWYDYLSAFVHPLHFILPLAVAFVFWTRSSRIYWRFVGSYLLLTYAGLVTYILYPMAPPWYASNLGYIAPIDGILNHVLWQHSASMPVASIYQTFNPNPVAAMPSLHAAFPVLVFLTCFKLKPRLGWMVIVYPLVMDFALVYMGEHYVIDVVAGTLYGFAAFAAVWLLPDALRKLPAPASPLPVLARVSASVPRALPRPLPRPWAYGTLPGVPALRLPAGARRAAATPIVRAAWLVTVLGVAVGLLLLAVGGESPSLEDQPELVVEDILVP